MIRPVAKWVGGLLLLALVAAGIVAAFGWKLRRELAPDPVTIAAASLQAVREQNRLTPFAARFVAVVTSQQSRFGLSARKTLIMPGLVRYEVDLGRLQQSDLVWNADSRTLSIALPPVEIAGPQVELAAIREYGEGGVLMALTDAEAQLDAANRRAGQAELIRQARDALPMRLARDAARNAIERSFSMPLRAAGIDATVVARFRDEQERVS
ncbi:hypothetical protein CLG96_01745 [Sphingomonas oleivorans]|uniref:DUF4230 domain-containing protein n=1 Tax=Sphingomonas oleivorans TaxID=1735121 RepID=A0A2T5G187_9SPHN|nr:DUF4230 domain-containing protein [Sphingomonas oleivorans]PTQ12890.1 hypothetical protein CLG96_01745 [Sphingomonas oleivorans]